MPIIRSGAKIVLYAHVPKCGGSAVSWYLGQRFGAVAFNDSTHTARPAAGRWSRTSPQHIDRDSLGRLFPPGFFDACFTIVRHPVARLVSAYHFQRDVEASVPQALEFSDWLADLPDRMAEDPFVFDNHTRPMVEIVPDGAQVFHMEHGLDALVPWFDALTGTEDGPRAVPRMNEQGRHSGTPARKARPTAKDMDLIRALYAADFDRFGYAPDRSDPAAPAPVLSDRHVRARDAELRRFNSPVGRLSRRIRGRLGA